LTREWRTDDSTHYDYESGEFDLVDGWQKITLGYRIDDFVAVWLNGVQVREITGVTHEGAFGEIVEIGKTNTNSSITPSGALRFDDVTFQIPRLDDLWVDAAGGDDVNDGLTAITAFRTIQKAADLAGARAAFKRALTIDETTFGPDHHNVARDVNNLGSVLKDSGDLVGARAAFERALATWKRFLPPEHPHIRIARENLARVKREIGAF